MDEAEILKAIKELKDETDKSKDIWDKLQALSAIAAAILIPLVLAYVSNYRNIKASPALR